MSTVPQRVLERAALALRAAGDVARLRLLQHLLEQPVTVSELAAKEAEALSTISQRLRQLRSAGLVTRRREGRHVYYALADAQLRALLSGALQRAAQERA